MKASNNVLEHLKAGAIILYPFDIKMQLQRDLDLIEIYEGTSNHLRIETFYATPKGIDEAYYNVLMRLIKHKQNG